MAAIAEILKNNGPMLSSEIKEIIMKLENISDTAARQRISRAKGNIQRLTFFTFPKNEAFLYLSEQYKTPDFYHNLYRALIKKNSITGNVLATIDCLSGDIEYNKFLTLSISSFATKRKTIETIKTELISVGFIEQYVDSQGTKRIRILQAISQHNNYDVRVNDIEEECTLAIVEDWLKKNSFVSFNKIKRFNDFSGAIWDLTAPSYLQSFTKFSSNKLKPGFIVIDILPQYNINETQIRYFIEKVKTINVKKNVRTFLPIIIGFSFSAEAFNLLKKVNVLVTTVENLIGETSSKLLQEICNIIQNSTKVILSSNEEKITNILKAVTKFEGKVNNIKGLLFEMIVANIKYSIDTCYIELNRKIVYDNKNAEIDVFCRKGQNEILVIEAKGYANNITEEQIDRWKNRMSLIYKWLLSIPENNGKKIKFEFWTTSDFDSQALVSLNKMKTITKKYSIDWKNLNNIKDLCKTNKLNGQLSILNEYFTNT